MTSAEDKLRELYAQDPLDQRAVALAERDVWNEHRASVSGPAVRRETFFSERFGVDKPTHTMFRSGLLGHDAWAAPLWSLIPAVGLGKTYRICIALTKKADRAEEAQRIADNPELARQFKQTRRKPAEKTVRASPAEARNLREKVRAIAHEFAERRLGDLEEKAVRDDVVSAFEIEIEAAVTDFLKRVDRLRRNNGSQAVVQDRKRQVRRACEVLGIKLPKNGGVIDTEAARKQHRKLSGQFHPDRTNGNEQLTEQYLEVQNAWEIIQEYQA